MPRMQKWQEMTDNVNPCRSIQIKMFVTVSGKDLEFFSLSEYQKQHFNICMNNFE